MFRKLHRALGAIVIAASLAGGWLVWEYQNFLATPLNVGPEGLVVDVPSGSSLRAFAGDLVERGVLGSETWFVVHGRLTGAAARIRAGEYQISQGMLPDQLLQRVVAGEVVQYQLTIVEGWTFRQLLDTVAEHPALRQTLEGVEPDRIMALLGRPEEHPEGRFAPDTYRFPRGMTDVEFLRRAYDAMAGWLDEEWSRRADGLPYASPYEALVMASIVEKETGLASERARIAGVFVRRLQRNMKLQTDPTVIYGMGGRFDGNLRRADLRRDTPYNTYTRKGLPPTPIALPGRASLRAALRPADGNTLYFVARGDGSHQFSKTLAEHEAAVRRYQLKGR